MIDGCDGCDLDGCGGDDDGGRRKGCGSWLRLAEVLNWPGRERPKGRRTRRRRRAFWHRAVQVAATAFPHGDLSPARPLHRWSVSRHVGLAAIRTYQRFVSSRTPARCRFVPTCSQYGLDAVRTYGLLAGSRLALARIRRCNRTVPCGTVEPLVAVPA